MHIAVTGANGFVGSRLVEELKLRNLGVSQIVRRSAEGNAFSVGDIGPETEWSAALAGADVVVHCAARVHIMNAAGAAAEEEFNRVNVDGTKRLAECAVAEGVRRIVFVSSIKVNGERTSSAPFKAGDAPAPQDPYARSKLRAEEVLGAFAEAGDLEVVVVRPPLVYGRGAGGNFARLIRLVSSGIPLPLALIDNRRSLVSLENLVDLLIACAEHPGAASKTFLVSDGEDLSTPDLIRRIAEGLNRTGRMFPVPVGLLTLAGRCTRNLAAVERLTGSLQVDIEDTKKSIGWTPRLSVDDGLKRALPVVE